MKKNCNRFISWIFASAFAGLTFIAPSYLQAVSDSPQIVVDTNSNRVVVWETFNTVNSVYEIRSAVLSGGTWQVFPNPISSFSTNSQAPILAGDFGSGNAIAVWNGVDQVSQNSSVEVALYNGSLGTWLSSVTISSPSISENASGDYTATIDGAGLACVSWSSFNSVDQVIYSATIDLSSTVVRTQLFP